MKKLLVFSIAVATLILVVGAAQDAAAQRYRKKKAPKRKKEKTDLTCTFDRVVARGIIRVKRGDEVWLVKVTSKPDDIRIEGTATADYLRPGMWVHFTAQFDKRGKAKGAVSELTVISRRSTTRPGVTQEEKLDEESPFNEKKPKSTTAEYFVVGQIKSLKKNRLEVRTGGKPVKVEVAEGAKVTLNVADMRVLRQGDSLKMAVWFYEKGKAVAEAKISGTLSKPLTGGKKKKRKRR